MTRIKKPTKLSRDYYSAYEPCTETKDFFDNDLPPEEYRTILKLRNHIRGEIELAYDTVRKEFVATLVDSGESRVGKTEKEALTAAQIYMWKRASVKTERVLEITWKKAPGGAVNSQFNKNGVEQVNWVTLEFNWQIKDKEQMIDPNHKESDKRYIARYRIVDRVTLEPVTKWGTWEYKGIQRDDEEFEVLWSHELQVFCEEMTTRFHQLGNKISQVLGPGRDTDKLKEIGSIMLRSLLPGGQE